VQQRRTYTMHEESKHTQPKSLCLSLMTEFVYFCLSDSIVFGLWCRAALQA